MTAIRAPQYLQPSKKTIVLGVFIAAYFLLALLAMGRFIVTSSLGDTWRGALLSPMVSGEAEKPFVYRILVPKIIGAVVYLTPQEAVSYMNETLAGPMANWRDHPVMRPFVGNKTLLRQAFENKEQYYLRLVTLAVVAEFLLFYIIALFFLAKQQFPTEPATAWFAPIIGLLIIPPLAPPTLYIYDFAVLFFSACCYLAIAAGNWRWYYVAFTLAFLNKESAAFIFMVFLLWQWPRMPKAELVKHSLAQLAIMAAIKIGLYVAYADNPGPFLMTQYIYGHMQGFLRAYDYKDLIIYLMAAFLLVFRWQEKPSLAKLGLPVFALMYVAFIIFGNPKEYRVFYDVMPLLVLLATHTLVVASGVSRADLFKETA